MNYTGEMIFAALSAMTNVMDLSKNDQVLIVTDAHSKNVAEAFVQASAQKKCPITIFQKIYKRKKNIGQKYNKHKC